MEVEGQHQEDAKILQEIDKGGEIEGREWANLSGPQGGVEGREPGQPELESNNVHCADHIVCVSWNIPHSGVNAEVCCSAYMQDAAG